MDENRLNKISEGRENDAIQALHQFNLQNTAASEFPSLSRDIKRKLAQALFYRLDKEESCKLLLEGLLTIRILSREKRDLDVLGSESNLKLLARLAGLIPFRLSTPSEASTYEVKVEAQKCLSNMIYNNVLVQKICSNIPLVDGIVWRLRTYPEIEVPYMLKFFDMRLLFLLTTLCSELRPRVAVELHGMVYLTAVLEMILRSSQESKTAMSAEDVDLASEILKILYNITISDEKNAVNEDEESLFQRLVLIIQEFLVTDVCSNVKKEALVSNCANLLVQVPHSLYSDLLTPVDDVAGEADPFEFQGHNMQAIHCLLDFLSTRLDRSTDMLREAVTPVLMCLCEATRSCRYIRKYCRRKILPPLKGEVKELPEDGTTLRNKLSRVLTHPCTNVKDLSADFLFILCKENTARFVKHVGYGNAAGLLAQRGLLSGGREAMYSSESSDSETEEYGELKEKINPITGRYEPIRENPMASMSEEQKEMEAMKLVEQIDRLNRGGIITPMQIGENGQPKPVEHVLQLLQDQDSKSLDQDNL